MKVDRSAIPCCLDLRAGWAPDVLNEDRLVLRGAASPLLRAFARSRGGSAYVDDVVWNIFSGTEGLSVVERRETGLFALIDGIETEHQLRLLAALRGRRRNGANGGRTFCSSAESA
ncbi:hypothetical protein [Burkholderia cepacia]|uniref:hypothetical protein n=1 Tax=Burkholderia cepacia TaxID=292 RepID=UPI00249EC0AA|nr:hypothetical protein [Burkholderia cepacia]